MTSTLADDAPTADVSSPDTLLEVIEVIPDSCLERPVSRGMTLVVRDLIFYVAVMAALFFATQWWLVIPLWALAGLIVAALFVLGHDAAHGSLFESRRMNKLVGRVLFIPSQHILESWVLGHNRIHHRHTARRTMDFVWHPVTPDEYAAMSTPHRLRHRVEWSMWGAGFYYLREVWWNKMIRLSDPPAKWVDSIKRDRRILAWSTLALVALVATLGWLWTDSFVGAAWMVVKLLVVPFLIFNWWIGFTVYVHHISADLPWPERKEWTKVGGQLDGTRVLRAPWGMNLFFHWIFVHVPHHVDPRIPCYHLEEAADAIDEAFPGRLIDSKLSVREYVRTTKACKLYDFDSGQWLTYRQAAALETAQRTDA